MSYDPGGLAADALRLRSVSRQFNSIFWVRIIIRLNTSLNIMRGGFFTDGN